MKTYKQVLMHIPHSSDKGLENSGWPKTAEFQAEVNKWTDWYTDALFDCEFLGPRHREIRTIRFPLSRFVLDVERLPDDPLESVGQGRIYHQFGKHKREVSPDDEARLLKLYDEHQQKIVSQLTPDSLLIDCHSFPSDLSDVDVCIGYNDDWSKPSQEVIYKIADTFSEAGYKVGINNPYSNSISPKCDFTYHSVMIEVNKRTYWDEDKLELTDGFPKLHALIVGLVIDLTGRSMEAYNLKFFLNHAYFFHENAERILSDPKMSMAPVPTHSHLAYSGTQGFRNPTLGVYLEWWRQNEIVTKDNEGKSALTYQIAGSPLTGINNCSCVYPDGTTSLVSFPFFPPVWRSFFEINKRYSEAKQNADTYTLQEVYEKLQEK